MIKMSLTIKNTINKQHTELRPKITEKSSEQKD